MRLNLGVFLLGLIAEAAFSAKGVDHSDATTSQSKVIRYGDRHSIRRGDLPIREAKTEDACIVALGNATLKMWGLDKLFSLPKTYRWRTTVLAPNKVWWYLHDAKSNLPAAYSLNIRYIMEKLEMGVRCTIPIWTDAAYSAYLFNELRDHTVVGAYGIAGSMGAIKVQQYVTEEDEFRELLQTLQ